MKIYIKEILDEILTKYNDIILKEMYNISTVYTENRVLYLRVKVFRKIFLGLNNNNIIS